MRSAFARSAPIRRALHVTGNIKFDLSSCAGDRSQGAELRERYAAAARSGSRAARTRVKSKTCSRRIGWCRRHPDAMLILVPRHPQALCGSRRWLTGENVRFVKRSQVFTLPRNRGERAASADAETEVLLVDTLGELLDFYAAGDVAFVGGSLVPVGGHNLLEPAALGLPVLTGPHNFNGRTSHGC